VKLIAGTHRARKFKAPKGFRTHPMSERIRGALFNSIIDISGLTLLDAFAGSGALSFEAVSRGAGQATAIERDFKAFGFLKDNVEELGMEDRVSISRANVSSWSKTNKEKKYDIVICDPPHNDMQLPKLQRLSVHLKPTSLFIVCYPTSDDTPVFEGLKMIDDIIYGNASVAYYRLG